LNKRLHFLQIHARRFQHHAGGDMVRIAVVIAKVSDSGSARSRVTRSLPSLIGESARTDTPMLAGQRRERSHVG
jgi:hypothetical protein